MITITTAHDNTNSVGNTYGGTSVSAETALERMVMRELAVDSEIMQLQDTSILFRRDADGLVDVVHYQGDKSEFKPLFTVATYYFLMQHHFQKDRRMSALAQAIFESGVIPIVDIGPVQRVGYESAAQGALILACGHEKECKGLSVRQLLRAYSLMQFDEIDYQSAFASARFA